jgi:hypothetical protein
MSLLAVRLSIASAVTVALVATVAAGPASAGSPATTKCPSAALVGGALGQKLKAPTSQAFTYAKICLYRGSGVVPTRVEFQQDTSSTFAAGKANAAALGTVVSVRGLGKAAYGTKTGGFLAVFLGNESIRITAPLVPLSKLEVLARKLVR